MRTSARHTCLSSEVYPLAVRDLPADADDAAPRAAGARVAILRLNAPGAPGDRITAGAGLVRAARACGQPTVPVRVAFTGYRPAAARWAWHLVHALRKRTTRQGAGVYHIDPAVLRRLGLEILVRHEANAYRAISRTLMPAGMERAYWDRLKESIRTQGFLDDYPILILLRRTAGMRDRLLQGHHRLAIALELGLAVVPVRFAYAGHAPWLLTFPYDLARSRRRAAYLNQYNAVR